MTPVLFAGAKKSVVAALRTIFNFLALNLALVVASLPVLTLPLTLDAATVALERWRVEGEDRVVREFLAVLRARASLRTAARAGVPILAALLALQEIHFFANGGNLIDWVCLGSGLAALVISLSSAGYMLLLGAQHPLAPVLDLWSSAVKLAVRNVVITGPLFVLEATAATLFGFLDPSLVLIGLPLGFLQLLRLTARLGIRRVPAPGRSQAQPAAGTSALTVHQKRLLG
jgi:hypothetical protein